MQTVSTGTGSPLPNNYYSGERGMRTFKQLSDGVRKTMESALHSGKNRLFSVETKYLVEHYLQSFPDLIERQYHNCTCCKIFISRYGGLVWIAENGSVTSAIWEPALVKAAGAPEQYIQMAARMKHVVEASHVKTQFLWKSQILGSPEAGGFNHFFTVMPDCKCEEHLTAKQAMAVRREDHKDLSNALNLVDSAHVSRAVAMLEAGDLARAEALLPMGKFFQTVQTRLRGTKESEWRNRVLWYYVGQAARGWCSPRSSAFGALVEDVGSGKSAATIKRSHAAKMEPTKYQRPQVAPSAGNIKQAEVIFEKMDLAPALRRRPMALEEAELLWRPRLKDILPNTGVFAHVTPKSVPPIPTGELSASPIHITFIKFQRDILPRVLMMKFLTPSSGSYAALTTAVNPDAPPIMMWDSRGERRNPGSWYLYSPSSAAYQWDLSHSVFVDVLGLAKLPPDWYGNTQYTFKTVGRVLIILRGAKDKRNHASSLFPEHMRNELHAVRSTIEAHSQVTPLEDEYRDRASGWLISDNSHPATIKVTVAEGSATYVIDRLE